MPTDHRRIHITRGLEGTGAARRDPGRRDLLEALAEIFEDLTTAGVDWDIMRESKHLAWPTRPPVCVEQLAADGRLTPSAGDVLELGPPLAAADKPPPSDTLGDLRSDER